MAKSGKLIFQGRSFFEGKIQKNCKKFKKIFIVPKRLLGHTNHLSIKAILSTLVYKAKMAIFVIFSVFTILHETNMLNMDFIGI